MEISINKLYFCMMLILVVSYNISCISGPEKKNEISDDELISNGWNYFSNKDYNQAITSFEIVIERTNSKKHAEAFTGKGWCEARLHLMNNSIGSFQNALSSNPLFAVKNDIYAGLCFVYDAQNMNEQCISASNSISPLWQFNYDKLDYSNIIILRAINFYAMGDFKQSIKEIQRLSPEFNCDVSVFEGRVLLAIKIEEMNL